MREHSTITGCRIGYTGWTRAIRTSAARHCCWTESVVSTAFWWSIPRYLVTGSPPGGLGEAESPAGTADLPGCHLYASADRICSGAREFSDLADRIEAAGAIWYCSTRASTPAPLQVDQRYVLRVRWQKPKASGPPATGVRASGVHERTGGGSGARRLRYRPISGISAARGRTETCPGRKQRKPPA